MPNDPSYVDPEGRHYDPDGYKATVFLGIGTGVLIAIGALLLLANLEVGLAFLILSVPVGLVSIGMHTIHKSAVAKAKFDMAQQSRHAAVRSEAKTAEISDKLKEVSQIVSEIQDSAIKTGDIVINGNDASVVVGSGSIEIIKGTKQINPELGTALQQVLGHLENIRNIEAATFFESFVEETEKDVPNKTVLRALWDSVVTSAPTIKHLADATAKITSLFV